MPHVPSQVSPCLDGEGGTCEATTQRQIQGGRALPGFLTAFHKQQVWLAVPGCGWHRWWAGQTSEDAGLSDGSDSTCGDQFKVNYVSVVSFLSDGSQPGLWGWTIEPELSLLPLS